MLLCVLAFCTSFLLSYLTIPSIIRLAQARDWLERPGHRKSHTDLIPALGGIGIFAGLVMALVLWMPDADYPETRYLFASLLIIFMIGVKDDLYPLSPGKKLLGQILASGLLVFGAGAVIPSFFGIFGWYALPDWFSYPFSLFTMLVIINAFNLIDGINGLSGSIGTLVSLFFGFFFLWAGLPFYAVVGFSLAGALIAFLRFNLSNRIFMGDTGALLIGLIVGLLTSQFLKLHHLESFYLKYPDLAFEAVPAVAIGLLMLPLFDTLRVFFLRLMRGRSPLSPDRSHIHHLLLDYGLTHSQATFTLVTVNAGFLLFVILFQKLGVLTLLVLLFLLAGLLAGRLHYLVERKKRMLEGETA